MGHRDLGLEGAETIGSLRGEGGGIEGVDYFPAPEGQRSGRDEGRKKRPRSRTDRDVDILTGRGGGTVGGWSGILPRSTRPPVDGEGQEEEKGFETTTEWNRN